MRLVLDEIHVYNQPYYSARRLFHVPLLLGLINICTCPCTVTLYMS